LNNKFNVASVSEGGCLKNPAHYLCLDFYCLS